jgi:tetratricopeptide (TPR) repeat protein
MIMARSVLGFAVVLLLASSLAAQNLREPPFVARAESGFDDIFNMDYDKAEQAFRSLEREYPQHPAPPMYLASIYWLKEMQRREDLSMNRFTTATYFSLKTNEVMPPQERVEFSRKIQQAEALCRAILQKDRHNKDGRYFLSTVFGLKASFAITVDHSLRDAFSFGNKAYSYARQLTDEDPKYYDAYMTVGIYEYVVGCIPWYLRWMIYVIGGHGSKQEGLDHLKLAAENGQYVKDQAAVVSMVLNAREHRYPESLALARDLGARFNRTYLFPLNMAQILQLAGRKEEAVSVLLQLEKRVERGEPNFNKLPLPSFRFNTATELLYMGKLDPASERFKNTIEDPRASEREKALSHLRLGQILSWQGQPSEAVKECQIVLSLNNIEGSHDQARMLLNKLAKR